MVSVLFLKLNGWPETFDERAEAIASHVDELVVIRPKPLTKADALTELDNIRVYDLYPERGSFVKPGWLKPFVFPVHVFQAMLLMMYLWLRGKLPPVIHAPDYALGGLAGAIASCLFTVPFVVSVRGLKEPRYKAIVEEEQTLRASISYQILLMITNFVIKHADHVVTKAEYQVEFVRDTFDVNPGFTTLPTGVDFELFDPAGTADNETLFNLLDTNGSLKEDDKIVLYLAKITPTKGPDRVIQLLNATDKQLPSNFKFVFMGEFISPTFSDHFNRLRSNLTNRTYLYPDRVSFEIVPSLLNRADAVILLSEADTEGVPRILQESCAIQTPIIASDVTGITKAFEDLPGCYLINRDDPQQFKTAVTQALSEPPEMPRELFADRFDMYRNYAEYVKIYKDLIE